ncbi:hypothetical protein M9458_000056, partial [Cirrhinus mrigala]
SVSVSISPSGEIVEGDSVTLICNSDSNPPALNFSWFKENQSSAVGSGKSFSTLQSGRFYCEAHNKYGFQRSDAVTVTGEAFNTLLHLHIIHQFVNHDDLPHSVHRGAGWNVTEIRVASGGGFIIINIIIIIIC